MKLKRVTTFHKQLFLTSKFIAWSETFQVLNTKFVFILVYICILFNISAPPVEVCTDGGNECAANTNGLTACVADVCVGK